MVSNATLHNFDEIQKKDIRVGDIVEIQRAGDVIPQVLRVVERNKEKSESIKIPKVCPSCNVKTEKEKGEAVLRCINSFNCEAQIIAQLVHFVSKKSLDIDGFGEKQVKQLYNLELIANFNDIYFLYKNKEVLINLDGWGELSFKNLINSIDRSKKINLDKFIFSLGIRYVGETISRLLAKEFNNVNSFIKYSTNIDQLELIDGLGPKVINSLFNYFSNTKNILAITQLIKNLDIIDSKKIKSDNFFSNKNLVFTGTLKKLSREEAKHLANDIGAKISSNISKNTDFLIIGENPGSKEKKAKELNIKILDEENWIKKINQ